MVPGKNGTWIPLNKDQTWGRPCDTTPSARVITRDNKRKFFMNNGIKRVCGLVILLAMTSGAFALDESDLLFYASFEGSVSPQVHSENTSSPVESKNIRFVKGMLGQGVLAGDAGSILRYPALGNIDSKAGTLSLWVRNQWAPTCKKGLDHSFVSIPGKLDCSFQSWQCMYFIWQDNGRGLAGYPGPSMHVGKDGKYEWLHMVFTWDTEGNFISYYNGKQCLHLKVGADLGRMLNSSDFFSIGEPSLTSGDHNRTEMDELMIFSRPLNLAEVKTLYRRPVARTQPTIAAIPLRDTKGNAADGKPQPGQGDKSFETGDFVDDLFGTFQENSLKMSITSDAEGVHLAIRDQKQLGDRKNDRWEIVLKPVGTAAARTFRCEISEKAPLVKKADFPWTAEVTTLGNGKYSLAAFIPWSSIGLDAADKNKTFNANMVRIYSGKRTHTLSWVDLKQDDPYATLIPRSEISALRISRFGNLDGCRLDLAADVEAGAKPVTAELYLQPSDLKEYYDPKTMPGTKSFTGKQSYVKKEFADGAVRFTQRFSDTDMNSVILRLTDSQGKTLFQSQKQFTPAPPIVATVKLFPSHKRVEVTSTVLPSAQSGQGKLTASIRLYDGKNNQLDQARIEKATAGSHVVNFSMAKLPLGEIKVVSTLFLNDKELFDTENTFTMLETSPDWIKHPAGIERRVTNGFSPVKLDKNNGELKIGVWGREYLFNNALLPSGVVSQTRKLLQRPAMLTMTAGGKELVPEPAVVEAIESADDQVSFVARQKIGDYTVTTRNRVEFDGLVWTQMKISPLKKGSRMDRVRLEFPFAPAESTLIHANNCSVSSKQFSGQTPAEWQSGFLPVVWLGNEKAGNCFFMETPVGCATADAKRFYEVKRDSRETLFRVNLVDHEISVEEPVEISFGWFATPARPLLENWLAWEYQSLPEVKYDGMALTRVSSDPCWDESNQFLHEAHPWSWFQDFSTRAKDAGIIALKYASTRFLSFYKNCDQATLDSKKAQCKPWDVNYFETPERKFWADEWKISPSQDYLCTNTAWRDLLCAGFKERIEKGGINGAYFDYAFPMSCSNPLHGCNQRYDILSQREIRRRLTNLFEANGKRATIMEHVSDNLLGPQMTFATCLLDGEHLSGGVENNDYRKALPLDRMRVMSTGANWGVIPMILFYGRQEQVELADSFMAIWALHMPIHNISCVAGYPINLWWAFKLDFDFGFDKQTRRLGYWENQDVVKAAPSDVRVTIYHKPGQILLVASNLSDRKIDAKLDLDLRPIGLDGKKVQCEKHLQNQERAPQYADGVLKCVIKANSCVMCILSDK